MPAVRLPLSTGADGSSIDVYLPKVGIVESWKGNAVVIVPGGAYNAPNYRWAKTHEGAHVARWIVSLGMMAVVLDYRLPQGRPAVPLSDALRAIETVRQEYSVAKSRMHHGKTWPIERVGVMGFSAGGHLAATAATLFTSEANRPDFAMLMCSRRLSTLPQHPTSARHFVAGRYPVVTMRSPLAHRMTRRNLFGPGPIDAALVDAYSAERHVTRRTPPTFVAHARDDDIVSWRHAELFCNASHAHGVPCDFLQLRRGGHAFVTRPQPWSECKAAAAAWLRSRGLALEHMRALPGALSVHADAVRAAFVPLI